MKKQRKGLKVVKANLETVKTIAQLYDTIILTDFGNSIKLNSGGFRTNHTKNCINDLLPNGFKVYQRNFEWFLITPFGEKVFKDNMVIDLEKYEVR